MDRLRRAVLAFGLLTLFALPAAAAPRAAEPTVADYLPAVQEELARLGIDARCEPATRTCLFSVTLAEGVARPVRVVISPIHALVVISVEELVRLPDVAGPSLGLGRRLLELNRELSVARLEWERATATIRISVSLPTDAAFDRRAFRSHVKGLLATAGRLWPELSRATLAP